MAHCNTRDAAAVMLAWAPGKEVEYKLYGDSRWRSTTCPSWNWEAFEFRIKPTANPKLRPWTADEVPLGAWMRSKGTTYRSMITSTGFELDRENWSIGFEHSTDCGKTWLPCGVMEESK